ncbi:hypothetical protein CRG98_027428 [Punica granatum]|uniref:Uncharacterized protein n=1 Tax=Punica granatum TaxID=22663 RepID=A0A2I0J7H6_PUNGR|nr:hypothetical protein CRG98_027428 [Punica granatum]
MEDIKIWGPTNVEEKEAIFGSERVMKALPNLGGLLRPEFNLFPSYEHVNLGRKEKASGNRVKVSGSRVPDRVKTDPTRWIGSEKGARLELMARVASPSRLGGSGLLKGSRRGSKMAPSRRLSMQTRKTQIDPWSPRSRVVRYLSWGSGVIESPFEREVGEGEDSGGRVGQLRSSEDEFKELWRSRWVLLSLVRRELEE